MNAHLLSSCTAFEGDRSIASGPLREVALAAKVSVERGAADPVLIFDDATGRVIDIDFRGSAEEVAARLPRPDAAEAQAAAIPRGRGRPRLGVVAREVTLLPRHWDWLGAQPGGASVALRKLVDEARRTSGAGDRRRNAQERTYHFMSAMAGNRPGFEEATRALFAEDHRRFAELIATWPEDIRDHATRLAFADYDPTKSDGR